MRKCDICGRGPQTGNRRSHSNIATKRKQALNLHSKIIDGKRIRICSKCLKKMDRAN